MILDLLAAVRRHHEAGLAIIVGAPVELVEAPFDAALALCDRFQDLEAGRNNFLANPVARNDRDPIAPHEGEFREGEETAAIAAERSPDITANGASRNRLRFGATLPDARGPKLASGGREACATQAGMPNPQSRAAPEPRSKAQAQR